MPWALPLERFAEAGQQTRAVNGARETADAFRVHATAGVSQEDRATTIRMLERSS